MNTSHCFANKSVMLLVAIVAFAFPACNDSTVDDGVTSHPMSSLVASTRQTNSSDDDGEREKAKKTLQFRVAEIDQIESKRELGLVEINNRALCHARLLIFDGDPDIHLPAAMSDINESSRKLQTIAQEITTNIGDDWTPVAHSTIASLYADSGKPFEPLYMYYKHKAQSDASRAIQVLMAANLEQSVRHSREAFTKTFEMGFQDQPGSLEDREHITTMYLKQLCHRACFRFVVGKISAGKADFNEASNAVVAEIEAMNAIRTRNTSTNSQYLDSYLPQLVQFKTEIEQQSVAMESNKKGEITGNARHTRRAMNNHQRHVVQAIKDKNNLELNRLLASIKDLNSPVENGRTYVSLAIQANNYDGLRTLLVAGADANRANRHGRRPIHEAMESMDGIHVAILLRYGANCELTDGQGVTACDMFAQQEESSSPVSAKQFKTYFNDFLKYHIDKSLDELADTFELARDGIRQGEILLAQNSGGLYPTTAPYQSTTVVSGSATSSDAHLWGGIDVDNLPVTLRDEQARNFRETQQLKIDLTPSPREFQELRNIEEETRAISRSNARALIKLGKTRMGNVIDESLNVLVCADVLWGTNHAEYRKVADRLKLMFSRKRPGSFDPNRFQKRTYYPEPQGFVIESPPIVGG